MCPTRLHDSAVLRPYFASIHQTYYAFIGPQNYLYDRRRSH